MYKCITIIALLVFASIAGHAESKRNCPAGLTILSLNVSASDLAGFDTVVQSEFTTVLQNRFGSHIKIVSNALAIEQLSAESRRIKALGSMCDPRFYPNWALYPPECQVSEDVFNRLTSGDDFLLKASLLRLGQITIYTASMVMPSNGKSIGRFSRSYAGEPVLATIRADSRAMAAEFAAQMIKYFYCVENDPKTKTINFDKPSERQFTVTSHVTQLSGDSAKDLSVAFSNRAPCCSEVSEKSVRLDGGTAKTSYTMTKKVKRDEVHAEVSPSDGIVTQDVTHITVDEKPLCLEFKGETVTTLIEAESGTTFEHRYQNSGKVPIIVDAATFAVSGSGKIQQKTTATLNSTAMPLNALGHTAPKGGTPVTITGKAVGGEILDLHLKSSVGQAFDFHGQFDGVTLPNQVFANPGFEIDVTIPNTDGATKREARTLTPFAGMKTHYDYDFMLKACD